MPTSGLSFLAKRPDVGIIRKPANRWLFAFSLLRLAPPPPPPPGGRRSEELPAESITFTQTPEPT